MNIRVVWQQPIPLKDGASRGFIYVVSDPKAIPERPGVYTFARRFGDTVSPLYIGQARNLKLRIDQQLNNVKLMMGIQNAQAGERIVLVGELSLQPGQQVPRVLDVVENALIELALVNEYELLNKQGTHTPFHSISFEGNTSSHHIAPARMRVRQGG